MPGPPPLPKAGGGPPPLPEAGPRPPPLPITKKKQKQEAEEVVEVASRQETPIAPLDFTPEQIDEFKEVSLTSLEPT